MKQRKLSKEARRKYRKNNKLEIKFGWLKKMNKDLIERVRNLEERVSILERVRDSKRRKKKC